MREDYIITSFYIIFNGEEELEINGNQWCQWHQWSMALMKNCESCDTQLYFRPSVKVTLWLSLRCSLQRSKMIFNYEWWATFLIFELCFMHPLGHTGSQMAPMKSIMWQGCKALRFPTVYLICHSALHILQWPVSIHIETVSPYLEVIERVFTITWSNITEVYTTFIYSLSWLLVYWFSINIFSIS